MNLLLKTWMPLLAAALFALPLLGRTQTQSLEEAHMPSPATAQQRVLIVVTNHADYPGRQDKTGLWLTELTHFWDVLHEAGIAMDIASPNGGHSPLDERSLGNFYLDDSARAHLNDPAFMTQLAHTKRAADVDPQAYAAIYFTGGHGTMWDFRDAPALKRLAEAISGQGGIVSAVCHGNAALVQLQGPDGKPLIDGRRVTGFSNLEERLLGMRDVVPFHLQDAMAGAGAKYEKALLPFTSYAITDGRLVTGQNPQSSRAVATRVLALLQARSQATSTPSS
ncbi:type 1 glutamine amidotransferase domain-containing protein [Variovorax boronicumulans]|uniref:type 1 glutamine amidotransferase domain-containing protein n=1 Tax=Variovorax boronicumulans TaxID=436515 RepID=UPI0009F378F1|nr:type 1 glutamine amidotransferase domain-containing protein [Variovorax boronicumulans]